MEQEEDQITAKDRRIIVVAIAILAAPVLFVLAWLVWAKADVMKPIDWIFIAIIPVTFAIALLVNRLAKADYWDCFKSGFISDIRNRRLVGEVSIFVVLMSLIAFTSVDTIGEGLPAFLWLLFGNGAGAILVITLFVFGEAWWQKRRSRDG